LLTRTTSAFGISVVLSVLVIGCGGSKTPDTSGKAGKGGAGGGGQGGAGTGGNAAGNDGGGGSGGAAGAEAGAGANGAAGGNTSDGGAGTGAGGTGGAAAADAGGDTTAPRANLVVSDGPTYDFGPVAGGATASHTFTVMNTGGAAATAVSLSEGAMGPFTRMGGTCTTTLAAGASCTLVLTFTPGSLGSFQTPVPFSYDDGIATQMGMFTIKGTGAAPAQLALSDDPTYAFGAHVLTTTATHAFVLTNTGGVDATGIAPAALAAPFAYEGGAAPGTSGTCTATLGAGKTCTIAVTFTPTAAGEADGTLTVAYQDGVTAQSATRAMTAQGTAPALLAISDGPTFDFGVQGLNAPSTHVFTISNTGGTAAQGLALASPLAAPFALSGASFAASGTCGATLAAFTSCTVSVVFTPTAAALATGTLTISYQDGLAAQMATRALTGTGTTHAFLVISDGATYDYGTRAVGTTTAHAFTVTNSGATPAGSLAAAALAAPFAFAGGSYPGTTGTCGTTLAAGASCTVIVAFAPTLAGAAAGTLHLDYDDGFGAQAATRAVKGAGTNQAFLALSDGPTYTFATTADGATAEHTFTVTNTGLADASALAGGTLAAPFAWKGGAYPGGGTCGAALASGASCTVIATFKPTAPGVANGTLSISYNDSVAAATASVSLQGSGALPALLALSDGPTYDFGTHALGTTTAHTFTVINVGGVTATSVAPVALAAPYAYAGGAFPGTGGTCTATLAPGTSCTVAAAFAPTSAGVANDKLQLGYADGAAAATASVGVTGTGAAPALLSISDGPTFDYSARVVGVTTAHTFTVTNGGGVDAAALTPAALASGFAFAGGAYPGTAGTCGATLAAGASCTVVVTFKPTSTGPYAASLGVTYANGVSIDMAARALTGAGVGPALLAISDGPTYDFQTHATGSTTTHTFTVMNSGGVAATSIAPSAPGAPFGYTAGAFPGTTGSCGATLAAGASCTFVVAFAPSATGTANDAVTLGYDDGAAAASAMVGLTGKAAGPAVLSISDGPTFDFLKHAQGSSTPHVFTVTNTGGVDATAIAPSVPAAPFAYKGGGAFPGSNGNCGTALTPGASCTFVVTFAPTAAGVASSSVSLGYGDGVTTQTAMVGLAGTGAAPALLSISDGPTYDFQTRATGSTTSHTFTVMNAGGVDAASIAPAALGAPYSFPGGFPGTGGNCGATLAAGASCLVVVAFAPTTNATSPALLKLSYDDGTATQAAQVSLTGTGAAAAALAISDGPTFDFGLDANGSVHSHTFVVTNSGGVAATGLLGNFQASPFSYFGGVYPGTGGDCGTSLGAGLTCKIVIGFQPTVSGVATGGLTVTYGDGVTGRSATVTLSGSSAPPANLAIAVPDPWDFGSVATNGSSTHVFAVTNDGGFAATKLMGGVLAAPYGYAGGTYPGLGGTCGPTLPAGAVCAVVVRFAPTMVGTFPATLALSYDDGANGQMTTRSMTGKGTNGGFLAITDFPPQYYAAYGLQPDAPTFDFGSAGLGTTTTHQFFVTNTGGGAASLLSGGALGAPFAYAGGTYPGAGGSCGATLAAGAVCTIVLAFHPTVGGTFPATFSLGYNDGTAAQSVTRSLVGTGTNKPVLTIWDFQTGNNSGIDIGLEWSYGVRGIGVTDDHSFFVTNSGGGTAISLSSPAPGVGFLYKGGTYPGTNGTCGTTLAAGASCSLDVAFSPVVAGAASGKILLNYTDTPATGTFQASRGIEGVGTNLASLEIWANGQPFDTLVYDFGFHATGSSTPHTFQLVNAGGATANTIAPVALPAPFVYLGGTYPGSGGTCGTSLGAGSLCTLVVSYAPTANGTQTGTIAVNYNDGQAAQSAKRDVMGEATSFAYITINNWPSGGGGGQQDDPFDFGTSGVPIDHTFALQNIGAQTATTLTGVAPGSALFSFKGGPFPGAGGSCGGSLAVGASCTIVVTFTGAATGASSWAASYHDGSGGTVQATRNVTGTSITGALLQITDCDQCGVDSQPADFGQTGGTASRGFTVRNVGSQAATLMADGGSLNDGFSYGSGGSYPGPNGNCGATLASGASCTLGVVFTPPSPGPHASTLTIKYNDGTGTQSASRNLTGTGVTTALLTISDWQGGGGDQSQPYDYGRAGVAVDHTFTVYNSGAQSATSIGPPAPGISAAFSYKGGTYPGAGGSCGNTLTPGASCNIVVTFTPPGAGIYSGTIKLGYGSNGGPSSLSVQRNITGTGITTALLSINPWGPGGSSGQPYDYGTFGAPTDHTFTVVNTGAQAATSIVDAGTLTGDFGFKDGTYPGTGGDCTTSLSAGAQCNIVVTFKPSGSGAKGSTITLGYNDGVVSNAQAAQTVTGTAVSGPLVRIYDWQGQGQPPSGGAQPPFDYGTWGVAIYHTFTVSNDGNAAASNLADAGLLGGQFGYEGTGYPGDFGGTCGTSLAAGAQCFINVAFTPSGSGLQFGKVGLNYTDSMGAAQPPVVRDLQGTSTLGALLSISDGFGGGCGEGCGPYMFPSVPVGNTSEQTFYIFNNGKVTAQMMSDSGAIALPFKYRGGTYPGTGGTCTTSLASGTNCSVVVDFAPTTPVTSTGSFGVGYDDGLGQRVTISRSLSGTGTP
jgi:hypothetical protein